jgi:amino-acid N-acetyltransferase
LHPHPSRRRSHDRINNPPQPRTSGHGHILTATTDNHIALRHQHSHPCGITHMRSPFGERLRTLARVTATPDSASPEGASATERLVIRRARTSDVPALKALVDIYSGKILLEKNLVTLYEAVQEFWIAELDGELIGCGALHVLWSDLGEVRTVAVHPKVRGQGVGHAIVDRLLDVARDLHLERIFVLTFEVEFFSRHGFQEIEGTPVTAEVYEEMCRSYDTGVAEFLDLSYVKPNILGNTRMLLTL